MARYAKALLLVGIGFLNGCALQPRSGPPADYQQDAEFNTLAEQYLAGYLAWRPQTATALGLHQYDGKVTDFTRGSIQAELARLKFFASRLTDLRTNALSAHGLYDYRILGNAIQREIFSFEQLRVYWENPMTYAGVLDLNVYIKRNYAPLEDRLRSIIAVLSKVPDLVAAAKANLEDSLPRPQLETAVEETSGTIDFLGRDLVDALKSVPNVTLMAEFQRANAAAIAELQNFMAYLKQEKLPKANEHYALGREKYVKLLAYGEMVTLNPEQLLEIGVRELRHQQDAFGEAARQIDPAKPPVEVFRAIQKDHPSEQNLISDTARDLERIRQFLVDHNIITLPSPVRARVKETPRYLRSMTFASMDTPGPFETKATEAYYYVTPTETEWTAAQKEEWLTAFNFYTTDIVSIHEAYPGHYVQYLCLNASPATKLEKIFVSYAFSEGWAHYAEQMMVDNGFGTNLLHAVVTSSPARLKEAAKYRMAQADEALLRVCRLCVSIQMHCQGMTVDQATQFFEQNCYYEHKPAHQEAMRGAYDPEYLYYTLGKLEFLKLRTDYQRQEGAHFSLKRFHDELLRHGAPPIRLLREVLLKDSRLWERIL